jgi:DNA primase small subunit
MKHAMEDIILHYTYPRIDAEVSKHRNHLLKAPFCVHPKTGRVCVPIDPAMVEAFDPEKVPTIGQLLTELDELIPVDGQEASGESLLRCATHWALIYPPHRRRTGGKNIFAQICPDPG